MNEELYSTNSELETVNDELRVRSGQLNQSKSFLESVMESMRAGVVVLDRDLTVESWNLLAEGGDSVPTRSEARTCSPWISGYRSTSCSTGSAIA